MSKPYAIVFDSFKDENHYNQFVEYIRSSFRAKLARENMFIIINDQGLSAKEIHERIAAKLTFHVDTVVIKLGEEFYGRFYSDSLNWLKENYPSENWL